ncbi:predicted protein [Pyrenophora tritici-repentis Pt-1C-BFP]|uniref:Uncharacterized protein n=1 Tax=Pyrenophora tritici-repentis (strain Pt-1C-BFP) TaxID=426418 RepID=B2VVL8_PYRTR|nr:uncharacterized protein PTRG_01230 [Pyrenophora tritici-repentis Pt-1C-BFP]EDU40668.1 predicted protein [Pyrenophora tritici-repentis Pt-1C-BFP]
MMAGSRSGVHGKPANENEHLLTSTAFYFSALTELAHFYSTVPFVAALPLVLQCARIQQQAVAMHGSGM